MGLDSVELVMEVEDHFGISIPDPLAEKVRTVQDLADLVLRLLPRISGPCPTAVAFHRIRRVLVAEGVVRSQIQPTMPIEQILPLHLRRRIWHRLRTEIPNLPPLALHPKTERFAGRTLSMIAVVLVIAFAASFGTHTATAGVVGLITFLMMVSLIPAGRWLRRYPGNGLVTVGDAATFLSKRAIADDPGELATTRKTILADVRRITAEQMGLPIEKVQPDSDFIRDLGLG